MTVSLHTYPQDYFLLSTVLFYLQIVTFKLLNVLAIYKLI